MSYLLRALALVACLCQGAQCLRTASTGTDGEAYAFMLYGEENHTVGLTTAIYNLREFDKVRPIVVITPKATEEMTQDLAALNATIIEKPLVKGPSYCEHGVGDGKKRLVNSFYKLHIWNLTQFRTVLYVETDMLFQGPLDEIFNKFRKVNSDEAVMIAPRGNWRCSDKGLPGDFHWTWVGRLWNTGIMAIRTSADFAGLYSDALRWTTRKVPCFGGSQELENILFHEFLQNKARVEQQSFLMCMPLKYNCKDDTCAKKASVIHWTGERKPWNGGGDFAQWVPKWILKKEQATQALLAARPATTPPPAQVTAEVPSASTAAPAAPAAPAEQTILAEAPPSSTAAPAAPAAVAPS